MRLYFCAAALTASLLFTAAWAAEPPAIRNPDSTSDTAIRNYQSPRSPEDRSAVVARMRKLANERRLKELASELGGTEFADWPDEASELAVEAFNVRGRNYWLLKQGEPARDDLEAALKLARRNGQYWLIVAGNAAGNLRDREAALTVYREAYEISGGGNGWLALSGTLGEAELLVLDLRTEEALKVLGRHGDLYSIALPWRIRMLRAYGKVLAAQGKDAEPLTRFREANSLEQRSDP